MTKYLWIPVAGTVAALVAIAVFRRPREGDDVAETLRSLVERPLPAPEHELVLAADGTLSEGDRTFASVEDVVAELASDEGQRPRITLRKASDEVTDEALATAKAALDGRFDVRTGAADGG